MKEFIFIYKEFGVTDVLFYFFYKVNLKFHRISIVKKWDVIRSARINKIYNALSLLDSPSGIINGKQYIQKEFDFRGNKLFLRPYSSDLNVFEQVIVKQEYKSVIEIYSQFFSEKPNHIFDCGANIGLTSIYFNKVFPDTYFTVIEPFEENIELIKMNFESAGIKKFSILHGGVWNKDTKLSISREFRDRKEWSISLIESNDLVNEIMGFSLLGLIEKSITEIDILKIDIEGTEKLLFENSEYSKQFLKKVKCIAIEIHDEFESRDSIYNSLRANGFFYFNSNELTIGINQNYIDGGGNKKNSFNQ